MKPGYGTGVAYVVARIKGDRPDIGKRIGKGEFKSARAAAREAGMVGESAAVIFQGETASWLKAEAKRREGCPPRPRTKGSRGGRATPPPGSRVRRR